MELDKELKRLRKERGITQEYLAKKLYVSVQTINKWENGKFLPDAINLLNIAQFYEVSLDYLMKNEVPVNYKLRKMERKNILFSTLSIFRFLFKKKVWFQYDLYDL